MSNSESLQEHPTGQQHTEREGFFRAAWLVAALTMLSRLLGLARDIVIVPLGAPRLADAFWTAFSVPNLFRRLFGEGALSAAFVPVFTEVAEKSGLDRARVVLANVAGALAVVLAGLVVLIELALAAAWTFFGADPAAAALLQLTAVMLPFMFTVCLLALGAAALQCRGRFAYPAAAPILLNLGLIAGAKLAAPALARTDAGRFFVIAAALVVTGVVQLAGVVWVLRRAGLAVVPHLRPVLPEVKRIAALMGPMLIPLSIPQLSALADRLIAWSFTATPAHPSFPLSPGVVRCQYAASRLYNFPLGVLAISVATVVFPLLSRYAAREDTPALRETINRALRLCLFLGVPAGVALIALAQPVVSLIFQRGRFTASDTSRAVLILRMYCLGMGAYFCNHILLRAFFARKDPATPLRIACVMAALNVLLVLGGVWTPLKAGAIGAATATTSTLNALALVMVLRRRLGRLGGGRILLSLLRTAVAAGVMAVAVLAVQAALAAGPSWLALAAAVAAGAAAYAVAALALRCPEVKELLHRPRK